MSNYNLLVMDHKSLIDYFYANPWEIESHFIILKKEFGLGDGRIDIIGRDKHRTICLVEIKTRDSEIKQGTRQMKRYIFQLTRFLGLLGFRTKIRGLVITRNSFVDVGTKESLEYLRRSKTDLDIPTSRKVYGLKGNLKKKDSNYVCSSNINPFLHSR